MKPCFILAHTGWKACATGILAHYRGQVRGIARKGSISDAISRKEMWRGVLYDILLRIGVLQELRVWRCRVKKKPHFLPLFI
jgi:hypothetical protein